MPCCVPRCVPAGDSAAGLVRFPDADLLRDRWKQAIEAGTGVGLKDGSLRLEVCLEHFAKPEDVREYQEPARFVDENGLPIELASCRLCLQFRPTSDMVPSLGQLTSLDNLSTILQQTAKIKQSPSDIPNMICTECLVKVDLIHALRSQFAAQDALYRSLQSAEATCQLEVVEATVQDEYGEQKLEPLEEDDCEVDFDADDGSNYSEEFNQEDRGTKRKRSKKGVKMSSLIARKCYLCKVAPFANPIDLLNHLSEEHAPEGDLSCAECNDGKVFETIQRFNRHMSHHDGEDRPLRCGFCPMRYCDEHGVHAHENREHGTRHEVSVVLHRPTACEECGKMFASTSNKKRHWKEAHGRSSKFECEFCEAELASSQSLHSHVLGHSKPVGHKCEICEMWFRSEAVLQKHLEKVHESADYLDCAPCKEQFESEEAFIDHLQRKHRQCETYEYSCSLCLEVPQSAEELDQHIDQTHKESQYPTLRCVRCTREFRSQLSLFRHRKQKCSKRSLLLRCEPCDREFATQKHLKDHVAATHLHQKLYRCDECGKEFGWQSNLDSHRRSVHNEERPFVCQQCGTSFKVSNSLCRHRKRCHIMRQKALLKANPEPRRRPQHACDLCDKTFATKSTRDNHRRSIHTGERSYLCQHCGMSFKASSVHSRHRKRCLLRQEARAAATAQRDAIRKARKPFACELCGKTFRTEQVLQKHGRNHHSGEKKRKRVKKAVEKEKKPRKKKGKAGGEVASAVVKVETEHE
ncbi:hypothetical protein pipiens_015358 [Culex pipiens pipiens]|uniref:Uncharacterized protein n=1 Tax=Culex pipiens pipiens TaxID=38569 RepID=A0ABD1CQR2_CULPP